MFFEREDGNSGAKSKALEHHYDNYAGTKQISNQYSFSTLLKRKTSILSSPFHQPLTKYQTFHFIKTYLFPPSPPEVTLTKQASKQASKHPSHLHHSPSTHTSNPISNSSNSSHPTQSNHSTPFHSIIHSFIHMSIPVYLNSLIHLNLHLTIL